MRSAAAFDQEHAALALLSGLDAACLTVGCGHEFGGHRFTRFALPSPCGVQGCRCRDYAPQTEDSMLDPFHDFGDPPDPDPSDDTQPFIEPDYVDPRSEPEPVAQNELIAQNGALEALSSPVGASDEAATTTSVRFPVVISGAPGVDLAALVDPARRVAEIIEAIQPVLVPPPTVLELEALVTRANALTVTDAATYQTGCELYELLAANEKGIEETIGPVVGFFHRPWKAMCEFRARFAPPVLAAKQRLSDVCGAWKKAEDERGQRQQKVDEAAAAADERQKLQDVATVAREQGQFGVAETATQMAAEVQTPALPSRSTVPGGMPTNGRKKWEAEFVDVDQIYRGIADGTIPKAAAPLDVAWWNSQAHDLKKELETRYPGAKAVEKHGLSSKGRRR